MARQTRQTDSTVPPAYEPINPATSPETLGEMAVNVLQLLSPENIRAVLADVFQNTADIFGPVAIVPASDRKVYVQNDDNGKERERSTVLCETIVPVYTLGGGSIPVHGRVYARLKGGRDGETIEPSISAPGGRSQRTKLVIEWSPSQKEAYRDHVESAIADWPEYDRQMAAAEAVMLGLKPPTIPGETGKVSRLAPRLVKRPDATGAQTGQQPAGAA